jgi:hypothetical protein
LGVAEKPWNAWWLLGIPVAWATSALILLGGEARVAGPLLFGCWLAWRCLGCAKSRRFVVWLTIFALPVHGFAAINMDLRGPSHYHGAPADSASRHAHDHAERHFHTHGQAAIEVDDGDRHQETKAAEAGKSVSGFDSLSPAHFQSIAISPFGAVRLDGITAAALPFQGRLERPPA